MVTDSVFSTDGALARFGSCTRSAAPTGPPAARRRGARPRGSRHRGRGLLEEAGLAGSADVIVTTTLSKALGSQGGAVLGAEAVRDHLIDSRAPVHLRYWLAPASVGAAAAALRILADEPWRVDAVRDHAPHPGRGVRCAEAAAVGRGVSHPGDPESAVAAAEDCLRSGVRVGCFRPRRFRREPRG